MNRRVLYAILFGVPGLFITAVLTAVFFGATAGVLWLFVFGDDPWPAITQTLLPAVALVVFLTLWGGIVVCGYRYGKAREDGRAIDRRHLLLAVGATVLPLVLIVAYQVRVGNLGPRPDSLRCSDYCRDRGYAGSGLPPRDAGERSCSCYDADGNEVLKVPLDTLKP